MKVLVVGGTGTLGRQIARSALDAGHHVRCMVRTPRKAAFLQEWGCELTRGDLLEPDSLDYALEGMDAVIDASTSRPNDPRSIYETDWDGKLNLLRACERAGLKRFVFLSLLGAHQHRDVPLMDIKACTEKLLESSDLDYTILQGAAFMQGVISQFAIPVLESQTVWVSGSHKDDPFRLMGFGHRVYKNTDPRAKVLKRSADEVLDLLGVNNNPLLQVAKQLEEVALNDEYFVDKKLFPNVDFYSGIILEAMGFPTSMFTPIFALSRTVGWISQWKEMIADPQVKIGRPRQLYLGEVPRDYTDIENR